MVKLRGEYTDEELNKLREAFATFDLDGNGAINVRELSVLLETLGMELSQAEVTDIVNEIDTDGSGEINFDEFHELIAKHSTSREEDVLNTWKELDVDGDGSISKQELKVVLGKVGIRLAPWELEEMMVTADTNGDGVIDYGEFVAAYDTIGWKRTNNLPGLMEEMKHTWTLLDKNSNGSVSVQEISEFYTKMGLSMTFEEAEKMVHAADEDYDGSVSYAEFLCAFHSINKHWGMARHLGTVGKSFTAVKTQQFATYKAWVRREREETGRKMPPKEVMLQRRGMRRHASVRVAIAKIWHALNAVEDHPDGLSRDLFLTYYTKLSQLLLAEDFEEQYALDSAAEEWEEILAKKVTKSMTKKDKLRSGSLSGPNIGGGTADGENPSEADKLKEKRLDYSRFFDSIFEVTDDDVGRMDDFTPDRYEAYIEGLRNHLVRRTATGWSWVSPDNVQFGIPLEWEAPYGNYEDSELDDTHAHDMRKGVDEAGSPEKTAPAAETVVTPIPKGKRRGSFGARQSSPCRDPALHPVREEMVEEESLTGDGHTTDGRADDKETVLLQISATELQLAKHLAAESIKKAQEARKSAAIPAAQAAFQAALAGGGTELTAARAAALAAAAVIAQEGGLADEAASSAVSVVTELLGDSMLTTEDMALIAGEVAAMAAAHHCSGKLSEVSIVQAAAQACKAHGGSIEAQMKSAALGCFHVKAVSSGIAKTAAMHKLDPETKYNSEYLQNWDIAGQHGDLDGISGRISHFQILIKSADSTEDRAALLALATHHLTWSELTTLVVSLPQAVFAGVFQARTLSTAQCTMLCAAMPPPHRARWIAELPCLDRTMLMSSTSSWQDILEASRFMDEHQRDRLWEAMSTLQRHTLLPGLSISEIRRLFLHCTPLVELSSMLLDMPAPTIEKIFHVRASAGAAMAVLSCRCAVDKVASLSLYTRVAALSAINPTRRCSALSGFERHHAALLGAGLHVLLRRVPESSRDKKQTGSPALEVTSSKMSPVHGSDPVYEFIQHQGITRLLDVLRSDNREEQECFGLVREWFHEMLGSDLDDNAGQRNAGYRTGCGGPCQTPLVAKRSISSVSFARAKAGNAKLNLRAWSDPDRPAVYHRPSLPSLVATFPNLTPQPQRLHGKPSGGKKLGRRPKKQVISRSKSEQGYIMPSLARPIEDGFEVQVVHKDYSRLWGSTAGGTESLKPAWMNLKRERTPFSDETQAHLFGQTFSDYVSSLPRLTGMRQAQ